MTVNVTVKRGGSENTGGVIRRFTKRVQGSGVLRRARELRYHKREHSKYVQKKQALKGLEKKKRYEKLLKLGKAPVKKRGRRR